MGVFYAGKVAELQLGSTAYRFSYTEVDEHGDILDTTNFSSAGYKENIGGLQSRKITCRGPYDTGAMALVSGTSYLITFTVGGSVTISATFRISDIKVTTDVNKVTECEFSAESTGSFTAGIS